MTPDLGDDWGGGFFDRTGTPITYARWSALFFNAAYRRIRLTKTVDGATISTVWIGLATGDEPPEIFETAISTGGAAERVYETRATEAEAIALHERIVRMRGGPAPPDAEPEAPGKPKP